MILDKQTELSNAQAITVSAASTNQIDLGPQNFAGTSTGQIPAIHLIPSVDVAFTAGGAATLAFSVRSSNNADMSSSITHSTSPTVPVASLVPGADFRKLGVTLGIPDNARRYVDVYYTVATGPMTAGQISMRASRERQTNTP